MATTVPKRSDVPRESTWDLESVFPTPGAWEAERARISDNLARAARYRGRLGESAAALAEGLEALFELRNDLERWAVFARLRHQEDTAEPVAAARSDEAGSFYAEGMAALSFVEPELLAIPPEKLAAWARSEPRLTSYSTAFDRIEKRRRHVRGPEVEELLGAVWSPFGSAIKIHPTVTDTDMTFRPALTSGGQPVEFTQGTYRDLVTSPDRELRRTAWESYADSHLALRHSMAACIATGVKQNVFMARARRYASAAEAALAPRQIPVVVLTRLIEVFQRHIPVWHRYWRLRRRALGLETLKPWDVTAPLSGAPPGVSWDESVDWISAGMAPLGAEYVATMRRGLTDERWVDRAVNRNKHAGAHSSGAPGTRPFILMSWRDDLLSLSTLAHELGHSMHSWYCWKEQPLVYTDYSIFVAEVASNFNQALVRSHLLATHSEPAFQVAVLEEAMANFLRYFFIMPTLARLELAIHEREERGQGLSADTLGGLTADLFGEGYGSEVELDRQRVGITWAEFPIHMYLNFYVFQYATGISAAHALADGVLNGRPGAAGRYLDFLKAGDALDPLEALEKAGVDMATSEPVEKGFAVMASMIDRLEKLLGVG